MQFTFQNANDAFSGLVQGFSSGTIPTITTGTRNGRVMQVPEPVLVEYTRPLERVLFNESRDCNPFFHLFESLWMLAGRNDVEPLARYSSKIADYSDDGITFNGAYGYRWRQATVDTLPFVQGEFGPEYPGYAGVTGNRRWVDQLKIIVEHLKRKPESRRVVLQMWDVEDDLLEIDTSKDVSCNTNAYFALRVTSGEYKTVPNISTMASSVAPCDYCLDMTVCNRSNDLVWGMLGANVVHFSFLQEYLAACLGVQVGIYYQFTNNLHAYINDEQGGTAKWRPEHWLQVPFERGPDYSKLKLIPLVQDPATFDEEVCSFIDEQYPWLANWQEPFINTVATPMVRAFALHKQREYSEAIRECTLIAAEDWRIAAESWIQRRRIAWERKEAGIV
jgi:thymidylate synthase